MQYQAPAVTAVTEIEGMLGKRISFLCPKDQDGCGEK